MVRRRRSRGGQHQQQGVWAQARMRFVLALLTAVASSAWDYSREHIASAAVHAISAACRAVNCSTEPQQ